jgi:hypothetical protein
MIKRIALVVVGALVALAGVTAANAFGLNPFQSRQIDRSQPALLQSIQNVSRFQAAVGNFEKVIDIEDDIAGVPAIIAGRRTLFVAAGTVNAYVDLSGLTDKDLELSPDGKTVTVRLPEPQLEKPNLDFDRSYTYSRDRGVVDRIADAFEAPDQAKLYKLAETKFAAAAAESELRKQATENTKAFLTSLCGRLQIQVTFID